MPHVVVNTPVEASRTCAIANVGIKGMTAGEMADRLMKEHKIYTVAIDIPEAGVVGCRVTPNVFTSLEELDKLVEAVRRGWGRGPCQILFFDPGRSFSLEGTVYASSCFFVSSTTTDAWGMSSCLLYLSEPNASEMIFSFPRPFRFHMVIYFPL